MRAAAGPPPAAPAPRPPPVYWEERARRFAGHGQGLAAVCSYGMPGFYNRGIELAQRLALRPHLAAVGAGTRVLDVGCGVGRWSRLLAARGARVTGIDLAPTMIAEARRRTAAAGLGERCRFEVADLAELGEPGAGERFERVLAVTVLQHILDPGRLARAVGRLTAHLAPGGRAVLLEAAPRRPEKRCDSEVFAARDETFYRRLFAAAALTVEKVGGVDPARLKARFLPLYGRLPRPLAVTGLAAVTALALPVDAALGRRWVGRSWHKVFVLRHAGEPAGDG